MTRIRQALADLTNEKIVARWNRAVEMETWEPLTLWTVPGTGGELWPPIGSVVTWSSARERGVHQQLAGEMWAMEQAIKSRGLSAQGVRAVKPQTFVTFQELEED